MLADVYFAVHSCEQLMGGKELFSSSPHSF